MAHVIEPAATGRAKCRGCGKPVPAGDLRFGERVPNAFAEGETTHWFHLPCAAYKRPEPLIETLRTGPDGVADAPALLAAAERTLTHRRLPRIDGAERAPTGRATCRSCREPIAKATWRIRLVFYEEDRFAPGGFIHASCALSYFETSEILEPLRHFSPELAPDELHDLEAVLHGSAA